MGLSREEQETVINIIASDQEASIYTCDPVWMRKLVKLADKYSEVKRTREWENAVEYTCPKKWIRIARPPVRNMTEEQKAAAAERIKAYHERRASAKS